MFNNYKAITFMGITTVANSAPDSHNLVNRIFILKYSPSALVPPACLHPFVLLFGQSVRKD